MGQYELLFVKSLGLTVFVETVVLFILVKSLFKKLRLEIREVLFAGFITSFATLPYLWFVFPTFVHQRFVYIITGELSVTLIEAVIYFFVFRTNFRNCVFISVACNLASFLIGLLIL